MSKRRFARVRRVCRSAVIVDSSMILVLIKTEPLSLEITETTMIDLYYWPTPNGNKITMMLEECELDYTIYPINITAGDQFQPDFLKLSPITECQRSSTMTQSTTGNRSICLSLAPFSYNSQREPVNFIPPNYAPVMW